MRICILGSGSSGNATLVVAGETRVLIDCGLSGKETIRRVQEVGEDPHKINAIVITHEHQIAEYGTRIIGFRDGRIVSDLPNSFARLAAEELEQLPVPASEVA